MKKIDIGSLILFEDEDFFFLNKPPHIASLEDRSKPGYSLQRLAKDYVPTASLCHRLDKETSGVVCISKNAEAYRHMAMQFEHREVTKVYHAVAEGLHKLDGDSVNLPILALPTGAVKIDRTKGKAAETHFFTQKLFDRHSLIQCVPITGRMHQIRIHLSCLKAPIVGDIQYGGKILYLSELKKRFNLKKETEEQPLMQRVALHAHSLNVFLRSGEEKLIIAPYPKDFAVLVKKLEEFGS